MGLATNEIKFLLNALSGGTCFRRTVTIGRQELQLDASALRDTLHRSGVEKTPAQVRHLFTAQHGYAEPLLELLGADEADSIDCSAFEGASIVHDMNEPIPEHLRGRFTAVLDGGSLEHVFDFPRAIRNCLEMVAEGGHFLAISPSNSYMGHGFYQFSPELYFRMLTPENGFELEKLVVYRARGRRWYDVVDPAEVGRRVTLSSRHPTLMAVRARRVCQAPLFSTAPQQDDYAAKWRLHASQGGVRPPQPGRSIWQRAVRRIKHAVRSEFHRRYFIPDRDAKRIEGE